MTQLRAFTGDLHTRLTKRFDSKNCAERRCLFQQPVECELIRAQQHRAQIPQRVVEVEAQ
jgi:hypothetical protein